MPDRLRKTNPPKKTTKIKKYNGDDDSYELYFELTEPSLPAATMMIDRFFSTKRLMVSDSSSPCPQPPEPPKEAEMISAMRYHDVRPYS